MAVAAELRRELLRALEAEVPVDDREDDDVVAAGRLASGRRPCRARPGAAPRSARARRGRRIARPGRRRGAASARAAAGMSFEPTAKSGVPGAVARPRARRARRSAALREASEARASPSAASSASAVIEVLLAGLGDRRARARAPSPGRPPRSAVMRSRTATSSRRKAMPSCCSRTTPSRRRISLARARRHRRRRRPSPRPLPAGEGGVPGRCRPRQAIAAARAESGSGSPRCSRGRSCGAWRRRPRRRGLADDALEGGDEFVGRVVERDDVGEGLELGQAARDDRLSRREVLVELDGIGRLGQRRAQERNRADVEAGDVARQLRVRHLAEAVDVGAAFEALERGALSCRRRARSDQSGCRRAASATAPASNHAAIAP